MKRTVERIIFLQGEEANEALDIYREQGLDAVFEYLSQWHYPGEHETANEFSAGLSDRVFNQDEYRLTVNANLNYIGLEYCSEQH